MEEISALHNNLYLKNLFSIIITTTIGSSFVIQSFFLSYGKKFPDFVSNFFSYLSFFLIYVSSLLLFGYFVLEMTDSPSSLIILFYNALSLTFLSISFLIFAKDKFIQPLSFLLNASAFFCSCLSFFLLSPDHLLSSTSSAVLYLHIFLAALGQGLGLAALCTSLLYLSLFKKLKNRETALQATGMSLSRLEELTRLSCQLGLCFLSASLVTGMTLVKQVTLQEPASVSKILWSFAIWGWFVILVFGQNRFHWSGKRGAYMVFVGAVLMSVTLFGTIWLYIT